MRPRLFSTSLLVCLSCAAMMSQLHADAVITEDANGNPVNLTNLLPIQFTGATFQSDAPGAEPPTRTEFLDQLCWNGIAFPLFKGY
jgi:hypothetical protein